MQSRKPSSAATAGCLAASLAIGASVVVAFLAANAQRRPDRAAPPGAAGQNSAGRWNALGNEAAERQDWEQAIKHYERASQLAPDDSVVLGNLGIAYYQNGRFDLAVRTLDKATGSGPKPADPVVLSWLAASHVLNRQYREGLERANEAAAHVPNDPAPQFWRARALRGLGRTNDARAAAKKALDLGGGDLGALALLEAIESDSREADRTRRQAADRAEARQRIARSRARTRL